MLRRTAFGAAAAIAGALWLAPAKAQDVLTVAPDAYKKVVENNRLRALEATLKPGARIATHSHPEHMLYLLTDGTLVIKIQGKTPYEMTFKAGEGFMLPAQTREMENNGNKTVRMLVVELKASAPAPAQRGRRTRRSR